MMRFPCMGAATGGALACAALWAAPAAAQSAPSVAFEAETDHRERGLSWSDGKAALSVAASVPVTYDLALDLDAVTLRESRRHGGADLGIAIGPRYTLRGGGWDVDAGVRGNLFVGRSGTSYLELTGQVARTLGPAQLSIGAAFAPPQDAIGGSNLYLDAQLSAGVPGTPVTLYGGLGHTSGSTRDDPRAARLRPGGDYLDHHFGAEYAEASFAAGIRYTGTSIGTDEVDPASRWTDRHYGARVVAYLRFTP
ncbi:MAG TPA: TorF family putative porin [Novosphingobium sp.]|nr:TorF family putative porin [Novosphingobium sp.]